MNKEITKVYQDVEVVFTGEGWFNATKAAVRFGKRPVDWLKQKETSEYIERLKFHKVTQAHFVKTKKGTKSPGTWMHPDLGVAFARWLDLDFSIWCDQQIKAILIGTLDVKRIRHKSASTNKAMQGVLKFKRDEQGKLTKPYHYSNEARLINWALTGQFTALDRDSLPLEDLYLLAALEERNTVLIGADVEYDHRKVTLRRFIDNLHAPALDSVSNNNLEAPPTEKFDDH